jgi:DNA-binding response OmpR family regulator
MTVLVVEDDPSLRQMLCALVQEEFAARIVEARDGGEALELAYRERPDVVVLDMMLPVVSGLDVARRLRADPTVDGLPILAMSAAIGRRDAIEAGCTDFLAKPFELDDLVGALVRHLRPMAGGALWPELTRARLACEALANLVERARGQASVARATLDRVALATLRARALIAASRPTL